MNNKQRLALLEVGFWDSLTLIGELFERLPNGATDNDRARYEALCRVMETDRSAA